MKIQAVKSFVPSVAKRKVVPSGNKQYDFSPDQQVAYDKVQDWLANGTTQIFRLFGLAGTGKTKIAKDLAAGFVPGDVLFAAYTGMAAKAMAKAGCSPVSTIHQLIYRPQRTQAAEQKAKLEAMLASADASRKPELQLQIKKLTAMIAKEPIAFVLNDESILKEARLLVLDECSMVSNDIINDLLTFGVPILVLGDPGQLPPIKAPNDNEINIINDATPDHRLTEIHRQAADSPILKLAMLAHQGKAIAKGVYGTTRVCSAYDVSEDDLRNASQILCGKNNTRQQLNTRLRRLHGHQGALVPGEKIICLRNDHKRGLLNGSLWRVLAILDENGGTLKAVVVAWESPDPEVGGDVAAALEVQGMLKVTLSVAQLQGEKVPFGALRGMDQFTYGYAITAHKAQGSQWDDVIVYNESRVFRDAATNWLYTAITRAASQLTLIHI